MVERFKTCLEKYFPHGPKIEFVVSVSLVILILVMFSVKKTVTISVDGKNIKTVVFSSTCGKILVDNGVKVGPKDKVKPSLDSKIKDNDKITVMRAVEVEVAVDGKKFNIKSAEDNVRNLLKSENIKTSTLDKVYPSKNHSVKKGMKIVVTRVKVKNVKESRPIEYETVLRQDTQIKYGTRKLLQEGQKGEKETVTRIIYEDGKEVSRKIVKEIIKRKPVQKVVAVGTLTSGNLSRGGSLNYAQSIKMRATAYTADYQSTGKRPGDPAFGITASGTVARRNTGNYSSIAVDPRVIPLGTKLYVEGYGYAIAEDTGGAIKGNRVDLFFNSGSEANNWGVKWVNVYVIG
ncbi:3D domain-containing protein [Clostridium luticellarii]|uniref:Cell wall-binding protein YocH n=1 Tax=Clostridium luticellarii TaxID=1691940 RepID=A0A2T0BE04_9CLOT|nr:3D domain-containing protein [Clostridium luticellarii]MCI1944913.1 3D domain-containing protein [Clostridium luticellarii]MCI1968411.1 3D domain-containing protein [Clostridium luticellarii]MCI1995409.1 3D domain-containing protein [Clostridium luticellarii]MCI2039472.1 3D domain-containing protein [Clostridium luticellarii]PRR82126.1 Cell wall-binding protein YocH precursor [Clostridium luticellarii]